MTREVVLIIMACLEGGIECKEYRTPALEPITEQACMASSLGVVAQWQERHPGLVIEWWRCEPREG